jgi:uncharacterized membrane protein
MTKRLTQPAVLLLILFIIIYSLFFTVQLILHYHSFGSRAQDLGNMDQTIWNTLHGRPFHQTNQPGANNRLSLHVEPILVPISLLYLFHSGPEILFLLQSVVVALGAIPVFALARLKLKNDGLALIFALIYLLFPAIQGATLLDFHAVTLAPTFLLAAFYFLETRRPGWFALFALLAAACKEEIALIVLLMGVYAFFFKQQRRLGVITVMLTGIWAFLAVFIIPPQFAGTENIHWGRFSHLGDSPLDIVLNLFRRPNLFLDHLQAVEALTYLRLLLTPTAFTALFSPITLLLALPSLGINLLSNFPPMQRVNSLIYAAPLVPAVIISSILGLDFLRRTGERLATRFIQPRSTSPLPWTNLFNLLLGAILLTAGLAYHFQFGYFPGGGQYRGWEEVTAHHRRAGPIIAQIPPDAALSAQDRLNPHASQRETLYIFDRLEKADHIILDVTEDSWPLHPVELRHRVDQFLENGFGILAADDGYLLLANRPDNLPTTLPDRFFDFARVPNPDSFQPRYPSSVNFDDKLQLIGYDIDLGAHEKFLPVVTLYWRVLVPLDENYTLWPFFIDRQGKIIEEPAERPLVTPLWYPTSRWSPEEIIITRTLPWDLAPNQGDQFTLAVGVAAGDWADPARRLPITQVEPELYTLDNDTWARLNSFERTGRKQYEPVTPDTAQKREVRQVQFWDLINLQGVELPTAALEPGQALLFALYWQATGPIPVELTTFAHLLDVNGKVVAQLDWTPQDSLGYLPTTAWQPGRTVADQQSMPLPADLPPGEYRLIVGWYYPVTGDRLPLTASDAGETGDVTQVGMVTVR